MAAIYESTLLFRQPQIEKRRNLWSCRKIEVRQHRHHVARVRIDSQISAHARRAAAVAHGSHAVLAPIFETVSVLAAASGIHLPGDQQFRVLGVP